MKKSQGATAINIQPLTNVEDFVEKQELTKHERFIKYGGGRAAQVLHNLEALGRCSDTTRYEYSLEEEVMPMFEQIRETLIETEKKFLPKTRQKFGRNFFRSQEKGDEE